MSVKVVVRVVVPVWRVFVSNCDILRGREGNVYHDVFGAVKVDVGAFTEKQEQALEARGLPYW